MKKLNKGYSIIIFIILGLEIFYFRNILFSDLMLGDFGDGKFCVLATEHWYKVLCGKEALGNLRMFYPIQGSFGYSDLFFGFAPLFCILRICGMDMYLSFKVTAIMIHMFGAFSMYYLLNRELKLNRYISIIGVMIFSYANMDNMATHPQLYAIYFIPFFIICVLHYFNNVNAELPKRVKWALLSLTSYAIIFYTGSYIGYFVILAALAFVILFIMLSIFCKRNELKTVCIYVKNRFLEILCYGAYGVAVLVPYLLLYIPANAHHGNRPWEEISRYLLSWKEYLYLTDHNLLWDNLIDLNLQIQMPALESQNGFPLITLIVFLSATIALIVNYFIKKRKSQFMYIIIISSMATWLCLSLIFRLNDNNDGLWYYVYEYLPGAGSMRALGRFNNVLTVPIAITVTWFLNSTIKCIKNKRVCILATICLLCGFMLEYTWVGGQYAAWHIREEMSFLESVREPPSDCETMFILYDQGTIDPRMFTPYQLNAWAIAYKYDLQSINGYTSYYPEGWEQINYLHEAAYVDHVKEWIERYDLRGVYAYIVSENRWVKYS